MTPEQEQEYYWHYYLQEQAIQQDIETPSPWDLK